MARRSGRGRSNIIDIESLENNLRDVDAAIRSTPKRFGELLSTLKAQRFELLKMLNDFDSLSSSHTVRDTSYVVDSAHNTPNKGKGDSAMTFTVGTRNHQSNSSAHAPADSAPVTDKISFPMIPGTVEYDEFDNVRINCAARGHIISNPGEVKSLKSFYFDNFYFTVCSYGPLTNVTFDIGVVLNTLGRNVAKSMVFTYANGKITSVDGASNKEIAAKVKAITAKTGGADLFRMNWGRKSGVAK